MLKRRIVLVVISFLTVISQAYSVYDLHDFHPDDNVIYMVKLNNGDMITGLITEVFKDDEGMGLLIKTEIGKATIYDEQIFDIIMKIKEYKHSHRVFLMPTAEPIGTHHYLGNFELLLFQLGFGISDFFSFHASRSFIPLVPSSQQITNFNAKLSLYKMGFEENARSLSFALGANYALINHNNQIVNIFGTTSLDFGRTLLTANVIYKAGARDYYDVYFEKYYFQLYYPNGAFGLGLGLDSKLPNRNDLHIIGEIWNIDVTRPTHTAILLGMRIVNTTFSADFGLAFFTQPFAAPFASFVWTPFD